MVTKFCDNCGFSELSEDYASSGLLRCVSLNIYVKEHHECWVDKIGEKGYEETMKEHHSFMKRCK